MNELLVKIPYLAYIGWILGVGILDSNEGPILIQQLTQVQHGMSLFIWLRVFVVLLFNLMAIFCFIAIYYKIPLTISHSKAAIDFIRHLRRGDKILVKKTWGKKSAIGCILVALVMLFYFFPQSNMNLEEWKNEVIAGIIPALYLLYKIYRHFF